MRAWGWVRDVSGMGTLRAFIFTSVCIFYHLDVKPTLSRRHSQVCRRGSVDVTSASASLTSKSRIFSLLKLKEK